MRVGSSTGAASSAWEEQRMYPLMDPTLRDELNVNCGVHSCVVSVAIVLYPSASCGRMSFCCFLWVFLFSNHSFVLKIELEHCKSYFICFLSCSRA